MRPDSERKSVCKGEAADFRTAHGDTHRTDLGLVLLLLFVLPLLRFTFHALPVLLDCVDEDHG